MIAAETLSHFNDISSTWARKRWVTASAFNRQIDRFVRASETLTGLDGQKNKSAAYFGIGTGVLFDYLTRYSVAGVDEARMLLEQCPEGVIQILSDVTQLPFLLDNQFHLVFSRNLLKHCQDPSEVVKTMYQKTRPGYCSVIVESVVLNEEDRYLPTELVRLTDPTHPPFRTLDEIISMAHEAGFSHIDYKIVPYRTTWLKNWVDAEQGGKEVHRKALALYKQAPKSFIERHDVVIKDDDVTSTVPWLMLRAVK
jgi:2-polyprenyl-3-methyl-5-hydroxy-6-metoxy-1,4-benzoquinol methylase